MVMFLNFNQAELSTHTYLLLFLFQQVNMVIGILVFNKLVSKDGITDKKLKERAGYALYQS